MRKITVTAAQIIAMREATMRDNGSYELTTAKGQTVNALIRSGLVVEGTRFLTVQGVSVRHSVCDVEVIASKGYRTSVSDDVDSLALFTLPPVVEPVDAPVSAEIVVSDIPAVDPSAVPSECYYGCGRPVTGAFADYVGRTEGVCDLDRSKLSAETLIVPVDPSVWGGKGDDVATVCVIQNTPGMNGRSHYHAPECRDVAREMKHWGQKTDDVMEAAFSDVAEILAFEYGDIASDSAETDTPEWWSEILHNATIDAGDINGFGVKIMPCLSIPAGRAGNGPLVTKDGFYRIGFDQPSAKRVAEIRAEIDAHECNEAECITCIVRDMNREDGITSPVFQCYGENGAAVHVSPCAQADGINGPVCSIDDDGTDANDAGFVETMVTMEYELSVIVDDVTGTRVSLGWVTLTMNSAQCMDFDRVAEEYGRTQNTRTPRHGWASIITVHDVADI